MEHMTMGSEVRQEGVEHTTIDSQTLHQAYFFITAGTAFAMGLRFAGSCDDKPYKCLVSSFGFSCGMRLDVTLDLCM